MGEILKGANGGFSGKAGSVIGSSWRSINYIRGLSKRSSKAPSELQVEQQKKFALVVSFLAPIKKLLEESFSSMDTSRSTAYNLGVHYNLDNAVTGEYPDFKIDFSKMVISRGSLVKPYGVSVRSMEAGIVTVSWPDLNNGANAYSSDLAKIVLYNATKKVHILSIGEAKREDKEVAISVPEEFSNDEAEVLIYFTSTDGRNSPTTYAGQVTIF